MFSPIRPSSMSGIPSEDFTRMLPEYMGDNFEAFIPSDPSAPPIQREPSSISEIGGKNPSDASSTVICSPVQSHTARCFPSQSVTVTGSFFSSPVSPFKYEAVALPPGHNYLLVPEMATAKPPPPRRVEELRE